MGNDISDNNEVAGDLYPGSVGGNTRNAFTWSLGSTSLSLLPELSPGNTGQQTALGNSKGFAVGKSAVLSGEAYYDRAFRWSASNNTITELATTGSATSCARDINDNGTAVGDYPVNAIPQACYWDSVGNRSDIPLPNGYFGSQGLKINNQGLAYGIAENSSGWDLSWTWNISNATLTTYSILSHGQLICVSNNGAMLFAGYSNVSQGTQGPVLRRTDGSSIALQNNQLSEGAEATFQLSNPMAMNDNRQIVLVGKFMSGTGAGVDHAVLASPWWIETALVPLSITMGDWQATDKPIRFEFEIRYGDCYMQTVEMKSGSGEPVSVTPNGSSPTIVNIPINLRGAVSIVVKAVAGAGATHAHWLRRKVECFVPDTGSAETKSVVLVNGDTDQTTAPNVVNTDDYLVFNAAFDTVLGDTAWDERADLNGDGAVNTDDYLVLSGNFDTVGDE